jgi:hypothetical protein
MELPACFDVVMGDLVGIESSGYGEAVLEMDNYRT